MSPKFKNILFFTFSILFGCASDLKKSSWYQIRNVGVSFEQATADCEYDLKKMNMSDARLSMAIFGLQHPTYESCMNRYGFAWQKNEN